MPDAHIRQMRRDPVDLSFAMRLKSEAGWNQTEQDWARFLALNPAGCLVAEWDGEPAGTGVVVRHGDLAWISMLLVDTRYRRRGIGRAVMKACIDHAQAAGARRIGLDATPAGRPLYETLGFAAVLDLERRVSRGGSREASGVCAMTDDDLPEVAAFDAPRFGADRRAWLSALRRDCPALAFLTRDDTGALAGFVLGRPGTRAVQIGPLLAVRAEAADRLLRAALRAVGSVPVLADVPASRPDVLLLMRTYAFEPERPLTRMLLGREPCPGRPECVYAVSGPDLA